MLVAAYGSLKKGFYNHGVLGAGAKFLGLGKVTGVMHLRWSYPTLTPPGDKFPKELEREHVLEIYDVTMDAYRRIENMELGAGYDVATVETDWGLAKIFYMPFEGVTEKDKYIEAYSQELFTKE